MIETLTKIKAAEQTIEAERVALESELTALKNANKVKLAEDKQKSDAEVISYRQEQEKLLVSHYEEIKQSNEQLLTNVSSQLAEQFTLRQEAVVESVLKEVENIYGHF